MKRLVAGIVVLLAAATSASAYDASTYLKRKAVGAVKLINTGSGYAVAEKQFDPTTGVALPDSVSGVTIAEQTEKLDALQAQMDQIKQFIADLKATP